MKNIFNSVLLPGVKSNRFKLSHDVKMSFSMGELVPTVVMECIPGDIVELGAQNMLRFAPLISPVMHKVKVRTDYFFVPNRLLWPDWEAWITDSGVVSQAPFTQITDAEGCTVGSLGDYLGYPTGEYLESTNVSPMPIAAYLKIWDEYYRDQNLQATVFEPLVTGYNPDYATYFSDGPLRRAWQHDYFTSALPFAQKGSAVQIPLVVQNNIPVDLDTSSGTPGGFQLADGSGNADTGAVTNATGPVPFADSMRVAGDPAVYDPRGTLTVDVQSEATDINTLRRAFRLQEWLERTARGGARYVENILAHFGVKSSDARLQRPEHIGAMHQSMVISEVLSTAENTDANVPVGQMAGHGISVGGGQKFRYRCEEHGFIIGIINVQPVTAYQDGLHRMFTRFDKFDYAWPTFANIGEQEVFNREVYARSTNDIQDNVFGYVPRYAEYKFQNSRVAGQMRSTLAYWHLGRIFTTTPGLNEDFVECRPSTRIFAVTDPNEDHLFAHIFNEVSAIRKLPRFGIPQI